MRCSPSSIRSRFRVMALCVFGLFAGLVSTTPVLAQGTMGTVPDPISNRELDGYAERLGLSRQQRQAIDALHDQYREEFTQLREKDIEKFISSNSNRGGMGGLGLLMDRGAAEKALKELDDIQNKIKAVDNRLFDQMQSVLTEDQVARMPLVRQARERVRYRTGLSRMTAFLNPASQVDLSELVLDLHLSAPELDAVNPALVQYETTLTSGARKLYDATSRMVMDALDQLQAQNMTEEAMRDPQQRGQMFQNFRTVMGDIQRKLAVKAADLSDLNRRGLSTLSVSLADDHSRNLRDLFYQRAYPEIGSASGIAERGFDLALKFDELTDEQRQTVTAIAGDYHLSIDRMLSQMADAIDDNRKTQTFFDFNRDGRRQFEEKFGELREKRTKLDENYLTQLKAALTPDLVERLDKRLADRGKKADDAAQITAVTVTGVGGGGATFTARVNVANDDQGDGDQFLPGAISKRDVDTYATRLNLEPEEKTVLNSLHDDYLEKFRGIEHDQINAVRQAQRQLWSMDGGSGQMSPPAPQAVDELYSMRKRALAAIVGLDDTFFNDAQVAVAGDEKAEIVQRLRSARLRQVYSRAGGRGFATAFGGRGGPGRGGRDGGPRGGPGRAAFRMISADAGSGIVDLSLLVDSISLTPSDPAQFNASILEYEHAATVAFQKLYESSMRVQQARDKMTSQFARAEGDGGQRRPPGGDDLRSLMETEGRAAADARTNVNTLNKSTLDRLMAALPDGDAQTLRRSYNLKAYPDVFRDSASAEPHLTAALSLGDLTAQQRSQVQEIAIEFRSQYDQYCDQLIAIEAAAPDMNGPPQGRDWQSIQEQFRTREKIEFDRNDLNDKTLTRLRSTLSEQQIQALGGLQPAQTDNG